MLFTITWNGEHTQNLGYLLHKNPRHPRTVTLSHGKAHVFYPEVSDQKTTAALLLSIDPIDLARGKVGTSGGGLFDYVNDRPYVCSSFMSTAIAKVYGTAMTGRADDHQALSDAALDLTATITMMPCMGDKEFIARLFEPLGYQVQVETFQKDEAFAEFGEGEHVNVTLRAHVRLRDLLRHVYVLLPVFDKRKHYWVGMDEVKKLMDKGADWLPSHPERAAITRRYLMRRRGLVDTALAQLMEAEVAADEDGVQDAPPATPEAKAEKERKISLNEKRLGGVVAALHNVGARSVIDLGCGEGNLLKMLVADGQFARIVGMDVSSVALKRAHARLKLDVAGEALKSRVNLFQGSLLYRDARLSGFDAACLVEVIEHMDPSRLHALERVLFHMAKPPAVVMTTPNREYNEKYPTLIGGLRHTDHRFEWTRDEFRTWAQRVADEAGYTVSFSDIGDADEALGAPTQMGVFRL